MPCTRNLSTKSLPRSGSILALACRGDGCCKMVGNPARPSDPDATWPTSAQRRRGSSKVSSCFVYFVGLTLERSASSGVLIEINHNTSPRAGRNARAHVPFGNLHKCQDSRVSQFGVSVSRVWCDRRGSRTQSTTQPPDQHAGATLSAVCNGGERGVWRAAETHRRHRSQQRPACACSFRPEGFTTITLP